MKWREPNNDMCPFNIFINDISECIDTERIIFHQVEDDHAVACSTSQGLQRKMS